MSLKETSTPIKILLVDPDASQVRALEAALATGSTPYQLTTVADGRAALAYLRQESPYTQATAPDLILLEVHLPQLESQDVLSAIKQDPRFTHIPILMWSHERDPATIHRCYQLHANAYIIKPAQPAQFQELLSRVEDFWFSIVTLFAGEEMELEEQVAELPTNGSPTEKEEEGE